MAKQNTPSTGKPITLSGRPKAFAHVKPARPDFMRAATGEREKAKLRAKTPQVKKQFSKAHEGPREKIATPKKRVVPTPKGNGTKEVHSRIDREKRARNQQKDQQMKKWRERKVPQPSRAAKPKPLLKKTQPDIFAKAAKKRSVKEIMQAKQAAKRARGGRGR